MYINVHRLIAFMVIKANSTLVACICRLEFSNNFPFLHFHYKVDKEDNDQEPMQSISTFSPETKGERDTYD